MSRNSPWSLLGSYFTTPSSKSDWSNQNTWLPFMDLDLADAMMPPMKKQNVRKKDKVANAVRSAQFDFADISNSASISSITGIDNSKRIKGVKHFDEIIDPEPLPRRRTKDIVVPPRPPKQPMNPTRATNLVKAPAALMPPVASKLQRDLIESSGVPKINIQNSATVAPKRSATLPFPIQNDNMVTTKRYRNKNIYRIFTTTELPQTTRAKVIQKVTYSGIPRTPAEDLAIKDFVLDSSAILGTIKEGQSKHEGGDIPYYDLPSRQRINSFPRDISMDSSSSKLSQMHVISI